MGFGIVVQKRDGGEQAIIGSADCQLRSTVQIAVSDDNLVAHLNTDFFTQRLRDTDYHGSTIFLPKLFWRSINRYSSGNRILL